MSRKSNITKTAKFAWIGTWGLFLAAIAGVYILFCPARNAGIEDLILFHPDPADTALYDPKQMAPYTRSDEYFRAGDGKLLHAWYCTNPRSTHIVLFNHGNGGNVSDLIPKVKALLTAGVSVFCYDYEGYGKSEGKPALHAVLDDATSAFDYLVKVKHWTPQQIIIYGESLGGGVACALAAQRQCAALILESTFDSLAHLGKEKMWFLNAYPEMLFPSPRLNNLAVVRGKHPPLLILAGAKDQLIPCHNGIHLYDVASAPRKFVLLPFNDHENIGEVDPGRYEQALRQFMGQYGFLGGTATM